MGRASRDGYNNVTNKLEVIQSISISLIRSPGKAFIYQVSEAVNSSWQIVYTGVGNLYK